MSKKIEKQQLLDSILDIISQIEAEDGFQIPKATAKNVEGFLEGYTGSPLDLFIVADRLKKIADQLLTKDLKASAYNEYTLLHGESKGDHKGVTLTPVEGYYRYDYPEDDMLEQYEQDKQEIKKKMEPLEKTIKSISDSIKERKKELEDEGKATMTSKTQTLKVSKG